MPTVRRTCLRLLGNNAVRSSLLLCGAWTAAILVAVGCGRSSSSETSATPPPQRATESTPGRTNPADDLRGWISTGEDSAAFVQWVEISGSIQGQIQQFSIAEDSFSTGFTGMRSDSRVSLTITALGVSTTIVGTLQGNLLTLAFPVRDGQLVTATFRPGTVEDYSRAVASLERKSRDAAAATSALLQKWSRMAQDADSCTAHKVGSAAGITVVGPSADSVCKDAEFGGFEIRNGVDASADRVMCQRIIEGSQVAVTDGGGHQVGSELCLTVSAGRYPWVAGTGVAAEAAAAALEQRKQANCSAIGGRYTQSLGGLCRATKSGSSTSGVACGAASISFTTDGSLDPRDLSDARTTFGGCYPALR